MNRLRNEIKMMQELKRDVAKKRGKEGSNKRLGESYNKRERKYPLKKETSSSQFEKAEVAGKALFVPGTLLKYIDLHKDGVYFVILILSLLGDLFGFAAGVLKGLVSFIPYIGWIIDLLLSTASVPLFLALEVSIVTLYFLAGHYKKRNRALKIMVTLGFDVLELVPIVAVLPGYTISFLINYGIILYGRALEQPAKQKEKKKEKKKMLLRERRKRMMENQRRMMIENQRRNRLR